jgi:hypothetical protein
MYEPNKDLNLQPWYWLAGVLPTAPIGTAIHVSHFGKFILRRADLVGRGNSFAMFFFLVRPI